MPEPIASGVIVPVPRREGELLGVLAREVASILRALRATSRQVEGPVPADADFVVLLVEQDLNAKELDLPDLKDRAGCALAIAKDAGEGRVAVALARKTLRAHGASLGARELVFSPDQFGILGLESDGQRERLEILLQALVLDAERLRLKREGWEEP